MPQNVYGKCVARDEYFKLYFTAQKIKFSIKEIEKLKIYICYWLNMIVWKIVSEIISSLYFCTAVVILEIAFQFDSSLGKL